MDFRWTDDARSSLTTGCQVLPTPALTRNENVIAQRGLGLPR
jgi:hypothetical protein